MNTLKLALLAFLSLVIFGSCVSSKPKGTFQSNSNTPAPDYNDLFYWAAHPEVADNADKTPEGLTNNQDVVAIDVFYVHPTLYYGKQKFDQWNAPINLKASNDQVDKLAMLYQASVFNGVGKVYAPRYRQAHIMAYSMPDTSSTNKAFELAYQDVKSAFLHYIKAYNHGRPFIIASHSQGTTHTQRLIRELVDGQPLQNQFIVGYLLGIPVSMDQYKNVKACSEANETGCLISWRTFKQGADHPRLDQELSNNILVTNPLSWKRDTVTVNRMHHKGAVLNKFYDKPIPNLMDAKIYKTILWVNKPKFRGSWLLRGSNYHRGDINLFYMDIRENAELRAKSFTSKSYPKKQ